MRYVVYGPGAVGGTIAGRLHEAGREVVLIARGAHLEALRTRGLELRDPERSRLLPIPAVGAPAEVEWRGAGDIAMLAMKTQDTLPALRALAASAPPSIAVACAQNGVANERKALRFFARVCGICVMLPGTHVRAGVVDAHSAPVPGVLDVGRYPTGADETAAAIAADLRAAGFESVPQERIMRFKYSKLLMNLGNALEAACGGAARAGGLASQARREALACFAAAGIDCATREEEAERRADRITIRPADGTRRSGSSSWQSLERRTGSIEADWLNGEIVLLGRLHGVPTPVNEVLQRVADEMAVNGEPPGSRTIESIEALLGS